MPDLPLPSDPMGINEPHWAHIVLDHPKLWGIIALLAFAATFSPRVSTGAMWACLLVAEATTIAFAAGLKSVRSRRHSVIWIICIGIVALVLYSSYGLWLAEAKPGAVIQTSQGPIPAKPAPAVTPITNLPPATVKRVLPNKRPTLQQLADLAAQGIYVGDSMKSDAMDAAQGMPFGTDPPAKVAAAMKQHEERVHAAADPWMPMAESLSVEIVKWFHPPYASHRKDKKYIAFFHKANHHYNYNEGEVFDAASWLIDISKGLAAKVKQTEASQ